MPIFFKRKRKVDVLFCAAVVVAAGSSTRMAGLDKIMLPILDKPMILYTLQELNVCPTIHEIVVVTREDLIVPIGKLCTDYSIGKVNKIIVGGETRTHSVRNGLLEVSDKAAVIAIHDGARPLVTQKILEDTIHTALTYGASAPAISVKDTIKRAVNGVVADTPDRTELFAVQTPQVFEADLIRAAIHQAVEQNLPLTDDCSAVERLGMKVVLTQGSEENIKVTTQADIVVAEAILMGRK